MKIVCGFEKDMHIMILNLKIFLYFWLRAESLTVEPSLQPKFKDFLIFSLT